MNAKLLQAILFSFTVHYSFAQADLNDSTVRADELVGIEQKLMDGVATGDSALWKEYLSPDFMIVNEDGSRTFYEEFLSSIKPLAKGVSGHINIKKPHFHFLGDIAVFNYVADEYENYMGQTLHTNYAMMEVYEKQNSKWKLMNAEVFEIPQLPPAIHVDLKILEQYPGTYHLNPELSCNISLENAHLYLQKSGREKEELFPETSTVFFRQADTRGRKLFVKDSNGKWQMHERRNGQDIVWKKD